MIKIVQTTDYDLLATLDAATFPADELEGDYDQPSKVWWVAVDLETGLAVAFGGVGYRTRLGRTAAYFLRTGVLRPYRGLGLQKRLIKTRLRHARKQGAEAVTTYTHVTNNASSNNLIKHGYTLYKPRTLHEGFLYWRKRL